MSSYSPCAALFPPCWSNMVFKDAKRVTNTVFIMNFALVGYATARIKNMVWCHFFLTFYNHISAWHHRISLIWGKELCIHTYQHYPHLFFKEKNHGQKDITASHHNLIVFHTSRTFHENHYILLANSNFFQQWTTGSEFISWTPSKILCLSSCLDSTRICLKNVREIFEKKVSTKLSHDPCLGVWT